MEKNAHIICCCCWKSFRQFGYSYLIASRIPHDFDDVIDDVTERNNFSFVGGKAMVCKKYGMGVLRNLTNVSSFT